MKMLDFSGSAALGVHFLLDGLVFFSIPFLIMSLSPEQRTLS